MANEVELRTVAARRQVDLLEKMVIKLVRAVNLADKKIVEFNRVLDLHTATGKRMGMMMRSNAAQSRITAKATADQTRRFRALGKEMQSMMKRSEEARIGQKNLGKNFSDTGRQMAIMMRSQKAAAKASEDTSKKTKGLSDNMRNLGSSAIFAFGPLSGVGARLVAFGAIAARTGPAVAALSVGIAGLTVALVKTFSATLRAGLQLDKIMGTLRAGTGSAGQAAEEFEFISVTAEKLGLNLATSARQFAKLTAAARGTSLEGKGVRDIFEGVSVAATAMQLSTDQTTGALRAIEQMISKGNVQAEELRGQLGERLPGAFQLAARSMGVTTQELNKMLEVGEVLASDLIPKLAKVLKESFSEEALIAAGKLSFQLERFKTEVFETIIVLERWLDSMGASVKVVRNVNDAMDDFNRESMTETFLRLQTNLRDSSKEMHRLVDDAEGISGLLKDAFGEDIGGKKFERQIRNAFIDSKLSASEFFAFVDKNREKLEALGFNIPVRFISQGEDPTAARTAAKGPVDQLPGMQLRDFIEFKSPDSLKELREELEEIGKTDIEKGLLNLDRQLKEIVKDINGLDPPEGLPDKLRKTFAAFKVEKIKEATAAIEELKAAFIAPDISELLKTIDELVDKEKDLQAVLALRIAGRKGEADALEAMQKALSDAGEGATEGLVGGLAEARLETAKMAEDLKKIEKLAKDRAKEEARVAKELEKQEKSLEKQLFSAQAANTVLRLKIAGEDEAAKNIEIQAKLQTLIAALGADRVAALMEELKIHEKLTEELKKQNELKAQREGAAEDLADLIRANAVLQQRIAGNKELADQMEARFELMKKFPDLTTRELVALQEQLELNKKLTGVFKEQEELAKIRKELAEDFASAIGTAFEDAIISGEKLSDVMQSLLDDINRIILRVLVTKPLENFLTGVLTGEDPTGAKAGPGGTPFFGGLLGDLFSGKKSTPAVGGSESPTGAPGPHASVSEATKLATSKLNAMSESSSMVAQSNQTLSSRILSFIGIKTTETVTTASLTGSLIEFQVAVRLATQALNAMAAGGAAGAASGGAGGLGSILNFGGSFGGNAGMPFGGNAPSFVPGFGFTGPRAHGGPTGPNSPVLVGENGPEVFRPNRSGMIEPITGDNAGSRPIVVNQVMNVTTPDEPGFRRSARGNMRMMGKGARAALRSVN